MSSHQTHPCYLLHEDNRPEGVRCGQPIPEQGWSYCPTCGRSTGHLSFDRADARIRVSLNRASSRLLTLRNVGYAYVRVEIELHDPAAGFSFDPQQACTFILNPRMPRQIAFMVPALAEKTNLGRLLIRAFDAPLELPEAVWQERVPRELWFNLIGEPETPADIRALEEAALFRGDLMERRITLKNFGSSPGTVLGIDTPDGYVLSEPVHALRLGAEEKVLITVHKSGRPPNGPVPMVIQTGGEPQCVELYSEPEAGSGAILYAVVGVDFGTTFTSIAVRHCRYNSKLPDDVEFISPPSENGSRFPTMIWVDRNSKQLEFGTAANDAFNRDPRAGYRFREIKTLLRYSSTRMEPDFYQIDPKEFRSEGEGFARQEFGEKWGEFLVTKYLQWLYRFAIRPKLEARYRSAESAVRYVFCVPVLDYAADKPGPQYQAQIEAMESCIEKAGFPLYDGAQRAFEFAFEPTCASLGLLHPPADVTIASHGNGNAVDVWPVLGTRDYPVKEGDTVAVFDSGGGTTDVVWASVSRRPHAERASDPPLDLNILSLPGRRLRLRNVRRRADHQQDSSRRCRSRRKSSWIRTTSRCRRTNGR